MSEEKQKPPVVCVVGDATVEPTITSENIPKEVEAKPLFTEADRTQEVTWAFKLRHIPLVVPNRKSRRSGGGRSGCIRNMVGKHMRGRRRGPW